MYLISRPKEVNVDGMFNNCKSLKVVNTNDKSIKDEFDKKRLNERIYPKQYNFDIIDYENDDIIDHQTIYKTIYKYHPKTKDELIALIDERYEEKPYNPYLLDIDTS